MDQHVSPSKSVNTRRTQTSILLFCTISSLIVFILKDHISTENKAEQILPFSFDHKEHPSSNPSEKSAICENKFFFGGPLFEQPSRKLTQMDRQKAFCLDKKVGPEINNCIVYSFGINFDWYFEESVEENLGCQIYAFDPSMFIGYHDHSKKIHFYPIALGSENTAETENGPWETMTLSAVYEMLSSLHGDDTIIDYLKINPVEDLAVLNQIIDSGFLKRVRQLSITINVQKDQTENKEHLGKISKVLQRIADEGEMARFDYRGSSLKKRESSRTTKSFYAYEIAWFNTGKLNEAQSSS